jgi:cyclophilin family peptidyl-prolyl cis-trans isomerase
MRTSGVVLVAVAAVIGGGVLLATHPGQITLFSYTTGTATSTPPASPGATQGTVQTQPPAQTQPLTQPATPNPSKPVTTAILHTSMGDIAIALDPNAPNTTANFVKLAQSGYYDGVKFHRVIKGFMDQAGDPLTKDDSLMARWGTGGPGYTISDENMSAHNGVGVVSMANTGQPNSGGSQFFINAADNTFLDGKYAVWGKVTAGLDVALAINGVQTGQNDRPLTPVVIKSVTLQ